MLKKIFFSILFIAGLILALGGIFSLGGEDTGAMVFMTLVGGAMAIIGIRPLYKKRSKSKGVPDKPGSKVDEQIALQIAGIIKDKKADEIQALQNLPDEETRLETLSYAVKIVVDEFLLDNLLSQEEEEIIRHFIENAGYSINDLNAYDGITDLLKASALRQVMNGKIPENIPDFQMPIQFNFMKSETMVWAFGQTDFYKEVTRRHYEGGHQGFSVRVAKGLYYRTGAFKGHPVDETEMEYQDTGLMALTTKHIYFGSYNTMFRIRYNKIVAFTPYDDGLGIMKDTQSAKPLIFKTGDGWLAYNMAVNLAQQME